MENVYIVFRLYSVYDEANHLCPFDGTLLEENVQLFVSGYVKPIYSENPDMEGVVPGVFLRLKRNRPYIYVFYSSFADGCMGKNIGPLTSWWADGFDQNDNVVLGFSSESADYYLIKASEKYQPFTKSLYEKTYLAECIIEFVGKEKGGNSATYQDLLDKLQVRFTRVQ